MRSCTSTATTRPEAPTRRASSSVKNPIPHPGSSTVMPSRTQGASIAAGSSRSLRSGLSSQYPSHQGQT